MTSDRIRVSWDMTSKELSKALGVKIKVEPIKKCWFIREDWSVYATIKGRIAHRVSYELCVGPLIYGLEICHHCDRKGCINPNHLFQGTHGDNVRDARNKYRIKPLQIRLDKSLSELRKEDARRKIRSGRHLNGNWPSG